MQDHEKNAHGFIAELWQKYLKETGLEHAGEIQRMEVRKGFYAGAGFVTWAIGDESDALVRDISEEYACFCQDQALERSSVLQKEPYRTVEVLQHKMTRALGCDCGAALLRFIMTGRSSDARCPIHGEDLIDVVDKHLANRKDVEASS